jgi:hypothetical protein
MYGDVNYIGAWYVTLPYVNLKSNFTGFLDCTNTKYIGIIKYGFIWDLRLSLQKFFDKVDI